MVSILNRLLSKGLIHPPKWLVHNTHYLTLMGSIAYGVSSDASDNDVYGFVTPQLDDIFPHLRGDIPGFGRQKKRFGQWQEHHIEDKEARKSWDFQVHSIVKYFQLCMDNNPNMIDSLFTPQNCVIHVTQMGQMVRQNRHIFLHKGCWHKFKGYAYSQLHKMTIKNPEGKRREIIDEFGYDVKFAYHVVRLINEVEQILAEGDLDLQRCREQLKSIRRGEWTEHDIRAYFARQEKRLEQLYTDSKLPYSPDEPRIKALLLECLEHHFGSLDKAIRIPEKDSQAMDQIAEVVRRSGR